MGERVERFAFGPELWRSEDDRGDVVEVLADGRVRAVCDGWEIRGGAVGPELLWVRGEDEHRAVAAGFTGTSPLYDVATARLLALAVGETRRVTLVELTEPVGAARTVRHGWARTSCDEPDVDRYEVADLDTAERWVLHLSGDVLISREGTRLAHLLTLT